MTDRRPRLAVFKFASCDGCQLTLLDCEDELLSVVGEIDIAHFLEASSSAGTGPYDVSLVEGSITTPDDVDRIQEVRRQSRRLVTIGACATAGGVQALRNMANVKDYARVVYAHPEYIRTLSSSTAISEHVPVDFELRGCPVNKRQLLHVISSFLLGTLPRLEACSVCVECKRRGTPCVMVTKGVPCLGPVTHAGCGALCPAYDRGCFGCYGPADTANTAALIARLRELRMADDDVARVFHTFNTAAPAFRDAGGALAGSDR